MEEAITRPRTGTAVPEDQKTMPKPCHKQAPSMADRLHCIAVSDGDVIDRNPLQALVRLAKGIARCGVPDFPQHSNCKAAVETVGVLAHIFRRVQFAVDAEDDLPKPALRCFRKLFEVLHRIRSLLEFCSGGSKIAILLSSETVALEFCDLAEELHDRLKPFPWELFDSAAHLQLAELKNLMEYSVMTKCAAQAHIDRTDMELHAEVDAVVSAVERLPGTFPDHGSVADLFGKLDIVTVEAQVSEVMMLESEITRARRELPFKRPGLEELVRYCKFVFLGESWPEGPCVYQRNPRIDWVLPPDFRCPIGKAVMLDPVTVSSGHTYERANIERWLRAGHRLCPVTHRPLLQDVDGGAATNREVQQRIRLWIKEHDVNLKLSEEITPRMVAAYTAERLASPDLPSATKQVLCRMTRRMRADARLALQMGDAGAVPLLLRHLRAEHPGLPAQAVSALHALSGMEPNKRRIMEQDYGAGVNDVIDLLNAAPTWEARGDAAGVLYQLSTVKAYRWCLAREARVVEGLTWLAREAPSPPVRGAALAGVLGLGDDGRKLEAVKRLLSQCRRGEAEEAARQVAVDPVLWLIKSLRDTSGGWRKRKMRRAAAALLDACMEWLWRGAGAAGIPDKAE